MRNSHMSEIYVSQEMGRQGWLGLTRLPNATNTITSLLYVVVLFSSPAILMDMSSIKAGQNVEESKWKLCNARLRPKTHTA